QDIESHLGYRLLPSWEEDEWNPTVRPARPEMFNLSVTGLRGFNQIAQARWGHLVSGGIPQRVLLEEAAVIVYSSTLPPVAYEETATVTVTLSDGFPECEIAIFYPGKAGDPAWEIRPIDVQVSVANVATIIFRRELVVIEDLLETLDTPRAAEGTTDADFLTTVDVYRLYNDPQQQVEFMWEPLGGCACGTSGCLKCQYTAQFGCLMVRGDPRFSQVVYAPATWNSTDLAFDTATFSVGRAPDIVRLWYYAGLRDKRSDCAIRDMDRDWARTVAIYAASKLDRQPCQCVSNFWQRWSKDLAFVEGTTELAAYNVPTQLLENPLGTRAGAVYAWQRIMRPGTTVRKPAIA
ncbi:hypothetical protein LCGC14_2280780, partial [marine sediment metagenome]